MNDKVNDNGSLLITITLLALTASLFGLLFYIYERQKRLIQVEELVEGFENQGSSSNTTQTSIPDKKIIWSYWETAPGKKKPGYIDLCQQSMMQNCGKCFQINILNEQSVYQYLPELRKKDLSKLEIPHKVDYYRYCLLEKYGGVWIDADMLIMKCICPFYNHLEKTDYVGFGCGKDMKSCQAPEEGYARPLNWFMMSHKNTDYIKCIKKGAEEKIDSPHGFEYHGIGRDLLADCHDKLKKEIGWEYSHMPCKCQDFDKQGNKLNETIDKPVKWDDCIEERIFFPLYNTAPGYPDWFKDLTAEELKVKETFLKPLVKLAFSDRPCPSVLGQKSKLWEPTKETTNNNKSLF